MMNSQRPISITIICGLMFVGMFGAFYILISGTLDRFPDWYFPYYVLSIIIGAACMVGFWNMKAWAANTYMAFAIISQIIMFATGNWNFMGFIIPAVVVYFTQKHYIKMY